MTDNQELLSRLADLDYLANKRQIICYSDFLNVDEYSSYLTQKHSYSCDTVPFSDIANLERQMIAFIPDAFSFEDATFPISILKLAPKNPKFAQSISHRDVLGALMSLGIERKLIGDIFISDKDGCFLVNNKIKDYIIDELHQIKRNEIIIKEIHQIPDDFKPKFDIYNRTISSLRLDCLVAEFANCSRSAAEKYVKQGQVFVNSKQIEQCSYLCKTEDIISVRGIGKMILNDIMGKSKKDKLVIQMKIFK